MAFSKCFIFLAHLFLLLSFSAAGHHHHGHHHHHHHHHHGHHHHGHHHHDHHHHHHGHHHHKHHHGYHHHGHGHTQEQKPGRISAVYAFGDSSVDTGNNNNNYNTKYRSDHLPYGADFPYRAASGRFSNGRLIVDYIVSSLGIKDALTAYLDPSRTEEDVRTGLSYGLAGTGLDDTTAQTNSVPTMEKEVISFENTVQHMFSTLGEDRTREIIGNALYVISVGTNDMLDTYYSLGSTLWFENVDVQAYHYKLLGSLERVMQRLYRSGARRFMVFGMPPIGCLPSQVETLFSLIPNLLFGAHCVRDHNIDAEGYNSKLQDQLWRTNRDVSDIHVEYVDIYNPMRDIIFNANNYGFQVSAGSCCSAVGAVPVMGNLCTELTACGNPDAYVFWDSINPSQAANAQLARIIESRVLPKFLG